MGIAAGFDMVPRLTRGLVDRHNWDDFIRSILEMYEGDDKVEVKPNYIEFKAGEHPRLPFEGHKFLRFSSKITGRIAYETGVENYIRAVTGMAKLHFGSRIFSWYEGDGPWGYYSWNEVNESWASYQQRDEPERYTTIAHLITGVDPIKSLPIPLFEVKELPDKRKTLVARFNIAKDTQLLTEKPLLTVPPGPRPPEELEPLIAAELKALPKEQQRQFFSLRNPSPGGKFPFTNIVKANALPCGALSTIGAVYATASLINRSSNPNARTNWDPELEQVIVYSVRFVTEGEEITIPSYQWEGDGE